MKMYFVRHGETEYNKNLIIASQIDVPLIEEGINEAKKALLEIPNDISEVYSSDLLRCKQTAEILNQKLNLQIKYDPRLRERDFGSLAGKKFADFDLDGSLSKIDYNQEFDYRPYGGESAEDVKKRVFSFIEDIRKNKKDSKVLVVTHAGIIRLLHKMLHNKVREEIHTSSIHEFDFPDKAV